MNSAYSRPPASTATPSTTGTSTTTAVRRVWFTGKNIATAKASRTNLTRTTTNAVTTAKTILAIGSVLIRDPFGWDNGVGVDYTQAQASYLHEQAVVVVGMEPVESGDPANDGYGRWVNVVELSEDVPTLVYNDGATTATGALVTGMPLCLVAASFALTPVAGPGASLSSPAGAGISLLTFNLPLVGITGNGDVVTNYTPGFRFKVLSVDFAVTKVVSTAAKAATLNLEIGSTNVTGGAVALTSANCTPLGALVAGSAITAANIGSATDTLSVEAASVTAFAEGDGTLIIKIQNLDTAEACGQNVVARVVEPSITAGDYSNTTVGNAAAPRVVRCNFNSASALAVNAS